jgi:galactokinase/mevalonate kinase-like predicted kinase
MLKNERVRETLLKFGIKSNIEIGSFAPIPMEVGFKSYASFTAALVAGLHSHLNKNVENKILANEILEIESRARNPNSTIQGIYSAVNGGINVLTFGKKAYRTHQVYLDFHERLKFEKALSVYFLKQKGIPLRKHTNKKHAKRLVAKDTDLLVGQFVNALSDGDVKECGSLLYDSWILEKKIGVNICPDIVNNAYDRAISDGTFGGKYVGDKFSGCLMLLGNRKYPALERLLASLNGIQFSKFNISLVQSGVKTLFRLRHE